MSFTELPDGAGGWMRVVPAPTPRHRWPLAKRLIAGALLAATVLGVAAVLVGNREPAYTWGELMEPDKPAVIDLGAGLTIRTACGAPGQRIYATNALPAERSGLGVSLTVPGGVAVVADERCQ